MLDNVTPIGAGKKAQPGDTTPPVALAVLPIATDLLKALFKLPDDMTVVGIEISEDGRTIGLYVEWSKLPKIRQGEQIPMLETRMGQREKDGPPELLSLRWSQAGNADGFMWVNPGPDSKPWDELKNGAPSPSEVGA